MQLYVELIHPAVAQAPQKKSSLETESKEHLLKGKQLLAMGQYDASIREYLKCYIYTPNGPPGDEANFAIGLIVCVFKISEEGSWQGSIFSYKNHEGIPHSKWSGHAKILLDLIQKNERLRRTSTEAGQENEN